MHELLAGTKLREQVHELKCKCSTVEGKPRMFTSYKNFPEIPVGK